VPSRLRRMILVNTRTSGLTPSASINEIDPRGGAAITGENSVGKTTTLGLLPLFFGTPPSEISATVGGREPMLRFVLQTSHSAIVYEYQVGSDPVHDIRCVVLRRHDPEDRAEYRFFSGSFKAEYFTEEIEPGKWVFRDDKQMLQALDAAGVRYEEKLSLSAYRSVILGLQAQTAEAKKLRVMSTTYGFGGAGARLTNLDKLISAVVKERVDFKDFLQLAVTIVQERLSAKVTGSDRYKITLPQSKAQIESWLEDRAALEAAMKQQDKVLDLREKLKGFIQEQANLGELRLLIPALKVHREHAARSLKLDLDALEGDWQREQRQAQHLNDGLTRAAELAQSAKNAGEQAVLGEKARQTYLHLDMVQKWSAQMESLPEIRERAASIQRQIGLLTQQATDIQDKFNTLISDVTLRGTQQAGDLRGKMLPLSQQCALEHTQADVSARRQLDALKPIHAHQLDQLQVEINELTDQIAMARAMASSAQASDELKTARQRCQDDLDAHYGHAADAQQKASDATQRENAARHAADTAEAAYNVALQRQQTAQKDVDSAQALLTPPDGSLLSALRADPGQSWHADLARVLDPQLLSRQDLSPVKTSPEDGTLYGWTLDLQGVAPPVWANDAALREGLSIAQRGLLLSTEAVASAHAARKGAASAHNVARKQAQIENANLKTLQGKTQAKVEAIALARGRCEADEKWARDDAAKRAAKLEGQRKDSQSQRKSLQGRQAKEQAEIESAMLAAKRDATARMESAIAELERQALTVLQASEAQTKDLRAQLMEQLSTAGVDTGRLQDLQKQLADLNDAIRDVEGHSSTVERWREWLKEGGHTILADLTGQLDLLAKEQRTAEEALQRFLKAYREREQAYSDRHGQLQLRLTQVKEDISTLDQLRSAHEVDPTPMRSVDPDLTVTELSTQLHRHAMALDEAERALRLDNNRLRDQLTAKRNKVSEFIEQSLGALGVDSSLASRAEVLCNTHGDLNKHVLPAISIGAQTILEKIRQFRSSITTFAGEVDRFNAELKRGLQSAAKFKRLSDFNAAVVTDFRDIGFFKGLDAVDEVAREAAAARAATGSSHSLPDEKTAAALRHLASLLGRDSTLEVNLTQHVGLKGSVTINGEVKHFNRDQDLEHISSTGINAIVLITLLSGMLNMIRANADVHIPWISDEVGKFDAGNFKSLMDTLRENRIDPVTASPKLSIAEYRHFARCYLFQDKGRIARYADVGMDAQIEPMEAQP